MAQYTSNERTLTPAITTAAILARGLGKRMRREDADAAASDEQAKVAETGVKGMIPIRRPFLEYVISALADAGITDVVLVLGPEHDAVRRYFTGDASPRRVRVHFALQEQPIGTADAVRAAADVIGEQPFLVLNADNYYPVEAYRRLAETPTAGTIAFDRDALVRDSNIDPERVRAFAVLDVSDGEQLLGIIEKPGDTFDLTSPRAKWVGMNCWAVTPDIVDACRRVQLSARGEYELPEAVGLAIREGVSVRAPKMSAGVLDLSRRSDIVHVTRALSSIDPEL